MAADPDFMEHILEQFREVSAFRVPPRTGAGGIKSGEWRIDDKIFTSRLQVVDCGETCELRLLTAEGETFAVCPVRVRQRLVCVEPASDSSRNFVIRVEDPQSKRHAFLGLSFSERGDAFDFNVALSDWEKHRQRGESSAQTASSQPAQDFSLKQGQSITVAKVGPATAAAGTGGFLSGLQMSGTGALSGASPGGSQPPESGPGASISQGGSGLLPPPPVGGGGLLPPPPMPGGASARAGLKAPKPPATIPTADGTEEWAAFD